MKTLGDFYPDLLDILNGKMQQERYYREFLFWLGMHFQIHGVAAKYMIRPTMVGDVEHSLTIFIDDQAPTPALANHALPSLRKREIEGIQMAFDGIVKKFDMNLTEPSRVLKVLFKPVSEALVQYCQSKQEITLYDLMMKRLKCYGLNALMQQESLYVVQISARHDYKLSLDECKEHIRRILGDHLSHYIPSRPIQLSLLQILFLEIDIAGQGEADVAVNF